MALIKMSKLEDFGGICSISIDFTPNPRLDLRSHFGFVVGALALTFLTFLTFLALWTPKGPLDLLPKKVSQTHSDENSRKL